MDLVSGETYWSSNRYEHVQYPTLKKDTNCDVVIVGGGITGAIMAESFVEKGLDVVLVDQRKIATGSTSASTMLLQYEIDTDLYKLTSMIGRQKAERAFKLCQKAIDQMEELVNKYNLDCDFRRLNSLYVASSIWDVYKIKREYLARKKAHFDVDYLSQNQIEDIFPFSYYAGIYNHHGAVMQPVRFTKLLLKACVDNGLRIYEKTPVLFASPKGDGILLHSTKGRIKAKKAVFCTGYESFKFIRNKRYIQFQNSYVIATNPCLNEKSWFQQCMIWESSRPYRYLRPTEEGRIVVGGLDDTYRGTKDRQKKMIPKAKELEKKLRIMFPHLHIRAEFIWAGMFGTTSDGLGYIGENKELPNAYFSLGFGGNGALYSIIARDIINDLYFYQNSSDGNIFSFYR